MPTASAIKRFKLLKGNNERPRFRKDRIAAIAQLEQEQMAEDVKALAMTEVHMFGLFQVR